MLAYLKQITDALRLKYSALKLQWIVGTMSIVSLLYLSSEEIWTSADKNAFPEVAIEGFVLYAMFFLIILFLVNLFDTRKVVSQNHVAIPVSIIAILIDIFLISIPEYLVLIAIQVLPQTYLDTIKILLLGAMPASIGAIVLTSLTADVLKKRAEKLHKEVQDMSKQMESLKVQINESRCNLQDFEKKKEEFEEYFKKNKKKGKLEDDREQ